MRHATHLRDVRQIVLIGPWIRNPLSILLHERLVTLQDQIVIHPTAEQGHGLAGFNLLRQSLLGRLLGHRLVSCYPRHVCWPPYTPNTTRKPRHAILLVGEA